MNTEKLDLINSALIDLWEQLGVALTEQKAIEEANSDEARECGRLAAEIVRVAGELGLDSKTMGQNSAEWTLIVSAAESGRGRLLSSAARRTKLTAAACFEADGKGNYRFINNRVTIVQPNGVKADFLATAAAAIKFMLAELDLETDRPAEIPEGPEAFNPTVVLNAGPDKTRVFQGLQIQFYKRDAFGELAKFDPKDWQFELKTSA